jgi:hypothetical protein
MLDPTEHDHEIWLWMPRGYRAWSWRPAFSGWKSWPQIPQVIGPGVYCLTRIQNDRGGWQPQATLNRSPVLPMGGC